MLIRVIKKLGSILSRHQILRMIELGIIMIVGGFLEMLSVSLIMPLVSIVLEPDKVMDNEYVKITCNLFGIQHSTSFLILITTAMGCVFIFKNLFLIFEMNVQTSFIYKNMFQTQKRLMDSFLAHPYEYFLKVKTGEVLRVVNEDTAGTFKMLDNVISLFTQLVVVSALVITVMVISPEFTILMGVVLFVTMYCITRFIRPFMRRAGLKEQEANINQNKWMIQAVNGIKEVKVTQKEHFFEEQYKKFGGERVESLRKSVVLGVVPKYLIESVCMGSLLFLVAFLFYQGVSVNKLAPALTAIAMAAIRLLPAVNQISAALGSIAYLEPSLDKTIENLKKYESEPNERIRTIDDGASRIAKLKEDIKIKGVTYRYPNSEKKIIDNASLTIEKGQFVGIIGNSGAGKTTTVDIILGLLNPETGMVKIDGADIKDDINDWLGQIGYIPQMIFLMDGSVKDNVAFGIPADQINEDTVWSALEEASLADFVRTLPEGLDTDVGERGVRLSGGQRQRIGIARALYPNPSILILDEATSALDNDTETAIMESINKLHGSKTMIIIAHRLTTIQNCDKIYKVENGKFNEVNKGELY